MDWRLVNIFKFRKNTLVIYEIRLKGLVIETLHLLIFYKVNGFELYYV